MTTPTQSGSVYERIPLSREEFATAVDLLYRLARISVGAGKEELIRSRLSKRVRTLGMTDFASYLRAVDADPQGEEAAKFVDMLTTNKTSFNREAGHFDYLRRVVLPRADARGGALRMWSAGCSTGEEPYTISMHLHEQYGDPTRRNALVLATDISERVLKIARGGSYEAARVEGLKPEQERKYFERRPSDEGERIDVRPELAKPLRFARLNLMGPWPVRGPFEAIFCRNVMIYFDRETREDLVRRFAALLHDGGTLFIGHSESLEPSRVGLRYVQPSVYEK